jgi:oligosaccharyltransferase complex subunit delta (ribophorin II)
MMERGRLISYVLLSIDSCAIANTPVKTQKDIPVQLLTSSKPLQATLLLASFGASKGFSNHVFNIEIKLDATTPSPRYDKPLRYGKLGEINHIFKADPKSGPKIVSLFFVFAVLASLPILLGMVLFLKSLIEK